jgi:hypothetical protein
LLNTAKCVATGAGFTVMWAVPVIELVAVSVAVTVWLFGTLILLAGYTTQGVALGRGRLVVVQPLMVTTSVWALPLGYWLRLTRPGRHDVVNGAALLAALGGAVLITLASRDTQLPGQPTGIYRALTDETLG